MECAALLPVRLSLDNVKIGLPARVAWIGVSAEYDRRHAKGARLLQRVRRRLDASPRCPRVVQEQHSGAFEVRLRHVEPACSKFPKIWGKLGIRHHLHPWKPDAITDQSTQGMLSRTPPCTGDHRGMRQLIGMSGFGEAPIVIRQKDQEKREEIGLNIPRRIGGLVRCERVGMLLPFDAYEIGTTASATSARASRKCCSHW